MAFCAYRSKAIHTSENDTFIKICKQLHGIYHNKKDEVYVLGGVDFSAYNAKKGRDELYNIDILIYINGTLTVVDVKGYGGALIKCGKDDEWAFADDKEQRKGKGGSQKNPYKQILRNKIGLVNLLMDRKIGNIKNINFAFTKIFGCVLFTQPIMQLDYINETMLDLSIRKSFKVSDMVHFHDTIDSFHNNSDLSGRDIELLSLYLNLEPYVIINNNIKLKNKEENSELKEEIYNLLSKLKVRQKQLNDYSSLINDIRVDYEKNTELKESISKLRSYNKKDIEEYILDDIKDNYNRVVKDIIPNLIDSINYSIRTMQYKFDIVSEYGGYTEYAREYIEKLILECEEDISLIESDKRFKFLRSIYKNPSWFNSINGELNEIINNIECKLEEEKHSQNKKILLENERKRLERENKEQEKKVRKENVLSKKDIFNDRLCLLNNKFENKVIQDKNIQKELMLLSRDFNSEFPNLIQESKEFDSLYIDFLEQEIYKWGNEYLIKLNSFSNEVRNMIEDNQKEVTISFLRESIPMFYTIIAIFLFVPTIYHLVNNASILTWGLLIVCCVALCLVTKIIMQKFEWGIHILRFSGLLILSLGMSIFVSMWLTILIDVSLIFLDFHGEKFAYKYIRRNKNI